MKPFFTVNFRAVRIHVIQFENTLRLNTWVVNSELAEVEHLDSDARYMQPYISVMIYVSAMFNISLSCHANEGILFSTG